MTAFEMYGVVEGMLNTIITMQMNLGRTNTAEMVRKEKDAILANPERIKHEYDAIVAVTEAMKSV